LPLFAAFSPPQNAANASCWSLAQEIVRIPTTALVAFRRHPMKRLGGGRKGTVYVAWIALNDRDARHRQVCTVAVKTDACYPWRTALQFWQAPDPDTSRSCFSDHVYPWIGGSFLGLGGQTSFGGAEYTGALVHYAQQQERYHGAQRQQRYHDAPVPGLLPTWALLMRPNSIWQRLRSMVYFPGARAHDDPRVVGTIMPLRSFQPLTTVDRSSLTQSVASYVQSMLPAARGLDFVNNVLGLAYQDIKPKNVGLLSTGEAFVYDHTYLGRLPHHNCTSPACRYCPEAVFPAAGDRPTDGHALEEVDFYAFRHVVLKYLTKCPDKDKVKELVAELVVTSNLGELISVLEGYMTTSFNNAARQQHRGEL
jgi:hypothetical protein